jgi:hypothetical protein
VPKAALDAPSGAWVGCRRVGVILRPLAEPRADGIVVDVVAVGEEVGVVADAAVSKATLPDWKLSAEAVREAAFDEHHGSFQADDLGCEEEMEVVGHDDEGVELVVAFVAVMLESVEEELGCGSDLEESFAVISLGADEEGAVACCSGRDGHGVWPSVPQRLKPLQEAVWMARLKPCPFEGWLGCGA